MATIDDFPLMPARYPGSAQRHNIAGALAPGLSSGGPGACRIDVDDNDIRVSLSANIDGSDPELTPRTIIPAGALPVEWQPAYRVDVAGFLGGDVVRMVFRPTGALVVSMVSSLTLSDRGTCALSLTAPRSTS